MTLGDRLNGVRRNVSSSMATTTTGDFGAVCGGSNRDARNATSRSADNPRVQSNAGVWTTALAKSATVPVTSAVPSFMRAGLKAQKAFDDGFCLRPRKRIDLEDQRPVSRFQGVNTTGLQSTAVIGEINEFPRARKFH